MIGIIGRPKYIVNEKIDWNRLSYNENAIYVLEDNIDKINWKNISSNQNAIYIY